MNLSLAEIRAALLTLQSDAQRLVTVQDAKARNADYVLLARNVRHIVSKIDHEMACKLVDTPDDFLAS
jgi:hypothetical protein